MHSLVKIFKIHISVSEISGYTYIYLFLHENMLWYSFELPRWGNFNEYPQDML